jgi:hypothetical protein
MLTGTMGGALRGGRPVGTLGAVAVGLALLTGVPAAQAAVQPKPAKTWVTNGPVYEIVDTGDTIYIGGKFTQVGPRTGPGVGIDVTSGKSTHLPEVSGGFAHVWAVVADGGGGWYLGGSFTRVGGVARLNIAQIVWPMDRGTGGFVEQLLAGIHEVNA